ncbi:MAG: CPBP family intramembrane metalloprotease [Candidatus Doudnabacteria bacterium]|nr:CPBP family intramembrane metalloprotease [Candidatus Doudnabacteria bacterium]
MKSKFFVLWFMGLIGAAAVLPYAFTLQRDIISKTGQPLAVIVLASIAQTAVLLAVAAFFGLKLATSLNLPVLAIFNQTEQTKEKLPGFFRLTISAGIITAILITLGDKIFGRYLPQLAVANSQVAIWKTLIAALYGGIVEEILMRLLVMSLFAWIIAKIFKSAEPVKNNLLMWSAIIISSVLFGLGHLPITASLTAITPLVVARAIVLNGIGGLVFGWLYWKKGLEYGMLTHFTADIFLLAILPALLK